MTMLYNGGSFELSDPPLVGFDQDGSTVPCIKKSEESYIVITDAMGKGIIYHED